MSILLQIGQTIAEKLLQQLIDILTALLASGALGG